jgi:hypothetical protein
MAAMMASTFGSVKKKHCSFPGGRVSQFLEAWQNGTRNTIATAKYALVGPDEKTAQRGPMSYTTYRYNSPTHYEVRSHTQISH